MVLQLYATFFHLFLDNVTTGNVFCSSHWSAEPPHVMPSTHIVNNCPSQCRVLKTGFITTPSQEALPTEKPWETNSCLPNTDLFTCGCPGSRQYRCVDALSLAVHDKMSGRVHAYKITRSGLSCHALWSPLSWQHIQWRLVFLSFISLYQLMLYGESQIKKELHTHSFN